MVHIMGSKNTLALATITCTSLLAMLVAPVAPLPAGDRYPFGSKFSGDGTFYGDVPPGDGNCAIEYPVPDMYEGMIPMAVSLYDMYDDSAMCGACIVGYGTGNGSGKTPITGNFRGFVSDSCEECAKGDLDFATTGDGRWDITWKFVECPSGGDPSFIFEGSNEWYWKIQPRGTGSPVKELWVDGEKATMTQDNFFTASGRRASSTGPLMPRLVVSVLSVNNGCGPH
eukprot:jgi/Undpi1/232/HiC_scaffold_1.g00229.m1